MNKGVIAVIAVFFAFWMFTDPSGLASFAGNTGDALWGWTQKLFTSVIEFVDEL
jgi:hypothetical protein